MSIPDRSGAVLARDGFEGLYCYPTRSTGRRSMPAATRCSKEIQGWVDRFPPYSEEREQFSAAL